MRCSAEAERNGHLRPVKPLGERAGKRQKLQLRFFMKCPTGKQQQLTAPVARHVRHDGLRNLNATQQHFRGAFRVRRNENGCLNPLIGIT